MLLNLDGAWSPKKITESNLKQFSNFTQSFGQIKRLRKSEYCGAHRFGKLSK